jgi:hypothetical protein
LPASNSNVYHTYFATEPGVDGRKTYWNHQVSSVAQGSEYLALLASAQADK